MNKYHRQTRYEDSFTLARAIRAHSLTMVHDASASHIGSCLSVSDVLAVLYKDILVYNSSSPKWPMRDRLILSKGHAAAALYAVLALQGFFPLETLKEYCKDGSCLAGHASHEVTGVEVSTGSLGHGLPIACGVALAGKHDGSPYRIFVILSDGELNEGSNWEAIMFAKHHKLDNLVAIIDYNRMQAMGNTADVLDLGSLTDKFCAFGWNSRKLDGHDHNALCRGLSSAPYEQGKPTALIAMTIKGKGVSFMENQLMWHYKSPNDEQLMQALTELGGEF